jgi:two-component system, sensor histidine kinase and response regulator
MDKKNPHEEVVKILIVEDSPTQAEQLKYLLEQHSYTVTVANSGEQALDHLNKHTPTLVISDIVMPGMSGYDLCQKIKSDDKTRGIPVILLTSLTNSEDVLEGVACGADNFITKPYSEIYLLSAINQIYANRKFRRIERNLVSIEILFAGKTRSITADQQQILSLLLSTYDAAVNRNKELILAQEELTKMNERLEDANKELESFSYSVSHDLRAPLRAIDSFSKELLEKYYSRMDDPAQKYLNLIRKNTQDMNILIDDLLSFSRIGKQEIRSSQIDMERLTQEIFVQIKLQYPDRVIDFKINSPPSISGDINLMKIVLTNLFSNAVKFTGQKSGAVIEFGGKQEDAECSYYVKDNGAGFDMKYAHKLFGVFQRLHSKEEFDGTGVGLALVQRIILRHGGRVWAEGVVGEGATFYFTLPVKSCIE